MIVADLIERLERCPSDLRVLAIYDCDCAEGDVVDVRVGEDFDEPGPVVRLTMLRRDIIHTLQEMVDQIRRARDQGLYYLALLGALTLPDICAGLAAPDGKTSGPKYKAWVEAYVPHQAAQAAELYGLRCSLLHQGSMHPHGHPYRIAAMASGQLHNLSTEVGTDRVGWLSIPILVDKVTEAAERWFVQYGQTNTVKRNLEKFARLRPEGLPPHVGGAPVIA